MAEFPFFPMNESFEIVEEILVRQEENAVGMLEDLERITGIPFGELLAEGIEEPEPELEEGELPPGFAETPEDTIEDEFDSSNEIGDDLGDYLDEIFAESDVDGDAADVYADNEV
jgi:hypothetical protein